MEDSLLKRTGCPFDGIHRRMEDVHTLWHQAQENYFCPQQFRTALQSCIMQMRTVTLVLQKQCGKIVPDFDSDFGKRNLIRFGPRILSRSFCGCICL